MVTISKNRGNSSKGLSITQVFVTLFLCCISYYTGTLSSVDNCTSSNNENRKIEELVVDEVKKGTPIYPISMPCQHYQFS